MDGDTRLDNREDIVAHILDFFELLYSEEDWDKPSLDNPIFATIGEDIADWLEREREFDEQEVREGVFNYSDDKAPGPDGYPMTFF